MAADIGLQIPAPQEPWSGTCALCWSIGPHNAAGAGKPFPLGSVKAAYCYRATVYLLLILLHINTETLKLTRDTLHCMLILQFNVKYDNDFYFNS